MKPATLQLTNSAKRSHVRLGFLLIPLACFALSPLARAVDPPPDGGYPGGNTAEGQHALSNLSRGKYNIAVGFKALSGITIGDYNTAVGAAALRNSEEGVNNTAVGYQAMSSNQSCSNNTAIGQTALYSNTNGGNNTATGTHRSGCQRGCKSHYRR